LRQSGPRLAAHRSHLRHSRSRRRSAPNSAGGGLAVRRVHPARGSDRPEAELLRPVAGAEQQGGGARWSPYPDRKSG